MGGWTALEQELQVQFPDHWRGARTCHLFEGSASDDRRSGIDGCPIQQSGFKTAEYLRYGRMPAFVRTNCSLIVPLIENDLN